MRTRLTYARRFPPSRVVVSRWLPLIFVFIRLTFLSVQEMLLRSIRNQEWSIGKFVSQETYTENTSRWMKWMRSFTPSSLSSVTTNYKPWSLMIQIQFWNNKSFTNLVGIFQRVSTYTGQQASIIGTWRFYTCRSRPNPVPGQCLFNPVFQESGKLCVTK